MVHSFRVSLTDKSTAVTDLNQRLNLNSEEMLFIGDGFGKLGNDRDVLKVPQLKAFHTSSLEETENFLGRFLDRVEKVKEEVPPNEVAEKKLVEEEKPVDATTQSLLAQLAKTKEYREAKNKQIEEIEKNLGTYCLGTSTI